MPAKFHPVTPAVWDRTMRELSSEAKVVRLYLLTCPSRVSEGLFHLPAGIVAHDTGLPLEAVERGLEELHRAGLSTYDPSAEVVLDRTALRYAPLRNGADRDGNPRQDKRIPGAVRLFENVPDTPLKEDLYRLAAEHAPDLMMALGERFPELTFATETGPTAPHRRGSEGASRQSEGASPTSEAPSRAEPIREEWDPEQDLPHFMRASGSVALRSKVLCAYCSETALEISGGRVREFGGRPYCGWCQGSEV